MTEKRTDDWERKDAWLGVLFLGVGAMLVLSAVLGVRNGMPLRYWGSGALIGAVMLLVGVNALSRSLRAPRRPPGYPGTK